MYSAAPLRFVLSKFGPMSASPVAAMMSTNKPSASTIVLGEEKVYVIFHLTSLPDLSVNLVCPTIRSDGWTDQLDPYHDDKD